MFRLVLVLACVAAAIAGISPLNERIVGGHYASTGQFPYQVSIRLQNGQHNCGGTIINSRFIITAAHCVHRRTVKDFYVVVGSTSTISGGTSYTLENLVAHAEYNEQTIENDIAILKTSKDIEFSSTVKAVPLQQDEVPAGSTVFVSGWGLTSWPGSGSPDLKYITPRAIDNDECAEAHQPNNVFDSQICSLNEAGQGACVGDSGGPFVYEGHLAGVVSWSRPCGIGYPDVFARISSYLSWIQTNVETM